MLITLEFNDESPVGSVHFFEHRPVPKNLNEYVIAPSYRWHEVRQEFEVIGWGLVHRSHIHPEYAKAMEQKEQGFIPEQNGE